MRSILLPLEGREVRFYGRKQRRSRYHVCLDPVKVAGRKVNPLWFEASESEILTAPWGARIAGYAIVRRYERKDHTEDLGLFYSRHTTWRLYADKRADPEGLVPRGYPPEAYRHLDLILEMVSRVETAPVHQAICLQPLRMPRSEDREVGGA
jgi:hypothetical protein